MPIKINSRLLSLSTIAFALFLIATVVLTIPVYAASTAFIVKGVWNTSFGKPRTPDQDGKVFGRFQGDFNGDGIGDILFADPINPIESEYPLRWTWLKGTGYSLVDGGVWSAEDGLPFFDYYVA